MERLASNKKRDVHEPEEEGDRIVTDRDGRFPLSTSPETRTAFSLSLLLHRVLCGFGWVVLEDGGDADGRVGKRAENNYWRGQSLLLAVCVGSWPLPAQPRLRSQHAYSYRGFVRGTKGTTTSRSYLPASSSQKQGPNFFPCEPRDQAFKLLTHVPDY